MRRSLLAFACLVWAVPSFAQTPVQDKLDTDAAPWTTDATAVVTADAPMTVGNFACVNFAIGSTSRTVSSVTDDGTPSNTYALAVTSENAGGVEGWRYCTIVTAAASTITVVLSSATTAAGFAAMEEWTGTHASDALGGTASGTSTTTTHSTGTVTVEAASSVISGMTWYALASTLTMDAAFASLENNNLYALGWDAVTGDTAMVNTSAANRTSVNMAIEILPADAPAGGCTGGLTLLGAGKC